MKYVPHFMFARDATLCQSHVVNTVLYCIAVSVVDCMESHSVWIFSTSRNLISTLLRVLLFKIQLSNMHATMGGWEVTVHADNTHLRLNLRLHSTQYIVKWQFGNSVQDSAYLICHSHRIYLCFPYGWHKQLLYRGALGGKCVGAWETARGTNHVPSDGCIPGTV